jgi:hypothetical protein
MGRRLRRPLLSALIVSTDIVQIPPEYEFDHDLLNSEQ